MVVPARLTASAAALMIIAASVGCGTTRNHQATEQLVLSDAVDSSVATIDFRPLADHRVYLDTTYLKHVKGVAFVNADYVTSALRQQILAAGCLLQDSKDEADIIIEARVGALGADDHRMTYGLPETNTLRTATALIPEAPIVPALPEISVARRESREGAVKLACFAYDRETRQAIWQSGVNRSRATARDTWVFGVGPIRSGTVREDTHLAGSSLIRFGKKQRDGSGARLFERPPVAYDTETRFQEGWPLIDPNGYAGDMLAGALEPEAEAAAEAELEEDPAAGGAAESEAAEIATGPTESTKR